MILRHRQLPAVVLGVALVLAAAPAFADDESGTDASGDAPAASDITRVVVSNSAKTFSLHVKLNRAKVGRTYVVATLTPTAEGAATYVVRTIEAGPGKKVGATLEATPAAGTEASAVDCPKIKAAVSAGRRGQAIVRVPQSCFGDDAGDMGVEVVTVAADGETADELPEPIDVAQG